MAIRKVVYEDDRPVKPGTRQVVVPIDRSREIIENPPRREKVIPAAETSPELFRIHGTWPFDFIPDELIIEEKRIITKVNNFPAESIVNTMEISKISRFVLTRSLIFSSLYIEGAGFDPARITLKWLSPSQARKAKEIVDGLIIKESQAIDIPVTNRKNVVDTVRTIGDIS